MTEQAARDKCSLTLHDNGDGTTTGHFTVPALAAGDARQGHRCDDRAPHGCASRIRPRPDRSFDWRHRRGLAFAELLEHLPTDHLHTKTAATVIVTIDHTVLAGALKAAHLDTGETLSAGEARRLACGAAILPAVLGARSVALDLGHQNRLFSEPQRLAKGLEHTTCAATGCERPYAWCELHHRQPWAQGGRPTSPTPYRCATNTTNGSTTPASTTSPCPTAASDSADARDMGIGLHPSARGAAPNDGYFDGALRAILPGPGLRRPVEAAVRRIDLL